MGFTEKDLNSHKPDKPQPPKQKEQEKKQVMKSFFIDYQPSWILGDPLNWIL